jgi:hypothetical protein
MENCIARQTTQVPICERHGRPVSRHRRYRRGSPGRDGAGFGVYVRPPQLAAFFTSAVLLGVVARLMPVAAAQSASTENAGLMGFPAFSTSH